MTTATVSEVVTYSRKEAARFLKSSPRTLKNWALAGKGPRYSRSGATRGRVIYLESDLVSWLESRRVDPTTKGG